MTNVTARAQQGEEGVTLDGQDEMTYSSALSSFGHDTGRQSCIVDSSITCFAFITSELKIHQKQS